MTCTACRESSCKYELSLLTLQTGKRLLMAVPEGVPLLQQPGPPPVAGNAYFCLQHGEGSDQDQRVRNLLLLGIQQSLLADHRLLLIPSEHVCARSGPFTREPMNPSHTSLMVVWKEVTRSLVILTLSSTGEIQHTFKWLCRVHFVGFRQFQVSGELVSPTVWDHPLENGHVCGVSYQCDNCKHYHHRSSEASFTPTAYWNS